VRLYKSNPVVTHSLGKAPGFNPWKLKCDYVIHGFQKLLFSNSTCTATFRQRARSHRPTPLPTPLSDATTAPAATPGDVGGDVGGIGDMDAAADAAAEVGDDVADVADVDDDVATVAEVGAEVDDEVDADSDVDMDDVDDMDIAATQAQSDDDDDYNNNGNYDEEDAEDEAVPMDALALLPEDDIQQTQQLQPAQPEDAARHRGGTAPAPTAPNAAVPTHRGGTAATPAPPAAAAAAPVPASPGDGLAEIERERNANIARNKVGGCTSRNSVYP
jgi:hypothetical protein